MQRGANADAGPDQARLSLALWLRQARAQRGMSVEDVSRITKIQPRILECLEAGQFERLPADVFVRGFVRSIARCVGLDADEALARLLAIPGGARGSLPAMPLAAASGSVHVARALVETMSELAPTAAGSMQVAAIIEDAEPVIEIVVTAEGSEPVVSATAAEAPEAQVTAEKTAPKKRRTRRVKGTDAPPVAEAGDASVAPRRRKKQASGWTTVVVEGGAAKSRRRKKPAVTVETVTEAAAETVTGAVTVTATETGTEAATVTVTEPATETVTETVHAESATQASEPATQGIDLWAPTDQSEPVAPAAAEPTVVEPTWSPRMPAAAPSVPWRRSHAAPAPVAAAPVLTIDDADPDRAERELEARSTRPTRRSFLPPILLDRDDRSARQGGLTLAVIILLIAATLTLSYLMRRPSSSGDGVTMATPTATDVVA